MLSVRLDAVERGGFWSVVSGSGVLDDPASSVVVVTNVTGPSMFRYSLSPSCFLSATVKRFDQVSPAVLDRNSIAIGCQSAFVSTGAAEVTNGKGRWSRLSGSGVVSDPNSANTSVSSIVTSLSSFEWRVSAAGCVDSVAVLSVSQNGSGCNCSVSNLGGGLFLSSCDPPIDRTITGNASFTVPVIVSSLSIVSGRPKWVDLLGC